MSLFTSQIEREWFITWVLLDVATRPPAGKRQTQWMLGVWLSRPPLLGGKLARPHMRLNDMAERRFVAVTTLINEGYTRKESIYEIEERLRITTAERNEILRAGYYKFKRSNNSYLVNRWLMHFRYWMSETVSAPEEAIEEARQEYIRRGLREQAKAFVKLVYEIRSSAQAKLYGTVMRNLGMARLTVNSD